MTNPSVVSGLSKSDFKAARTCSAKLYYRKLGYASTSDNDEYMQMLADGGYMVELLAKLLHPNGVAVTMNDGINSAAAVTMQLLLQDSVVLFDAVLCSDSKIARTDILKKHNQTFDLFEVKARSLGQEELDAYRANGKSPFSLKRGTGILADWRTDIEDVAFQIAILMDLFPNATVRPHLVLVDKTQTAAIDRMPDLFSIERWVDASGASRVQGARFLGDAATQLGDPLVVTISVDAEVEMVLAEVREAAHVFAESLRDGVKRLSAPLGTHCRDCEFRTDDATIQDGFRECWGTRADTTPHILELYKRPKVLDELICNGASSLFEIPTDRLRTKDGKIGADAKRQLKQIEHTRAGTEWIDDTLADCLRNVSYPLHFLDFETSRLAVPYHQGMRPYGLVAFQWSCHTIERPGSAPIHREWLNDRDMWPNVEFAATLRMAIGSEGTILAWASHERSTLGEIARDLIAFGYDKDGLVAWINDIVATDRIVDLNQLTLKGYFHPGMGGSTSVKKVLDAVWRGNVRMHERFTAETGRAVDPSQGPYATLPTLLIDGQAQNVRDGTGAMRVYQAMMYGVERSNEMVRAQWRELLLQYCELDTLAMLLIWEHWERLSVEVVSSA
jgi:hypothetical protein